MSNWLDMSPDRLETLLEHDHKHRWNTITNHLGSMGSMPLPRCMLCCHSGEEEMNSCWSSREAPGTSSGPWPSPGGKSIGRLNYPKMLIFELIYDWLKKPDTVCYGKRKSMENSKIVVSVWRAAKLSRIHTNFEVLCREEPACTRGGAQGGQLKFHKINSFLTI